MEIWQLILMLFAFISVLGFFAKVLLRSFDQRFAAQEAARAADRKHTDELHAQNQRAITDWHDHFRGLERKLLELKADLPINYVRREDYIRGQTVLEAKMDGLALKIENIQLQGKVGGH